MIVVDCIMTVILVQGVNPDTRFVVLENYHSIVNWLGSSRRGLFVRVFGYDIHLKEVK
jgi:hypothetical protein